MWKVAEWIQFREKNP